MFFESFLINLSVIVILIVALIFDYVTKFFSYWYVRHIPYKTSIPFLGGDYHRVFGIRNSSDEINKLYTEYPKAKFVGKLKCRIPDMIVKDPDAIKRMMSTDFANFYSRGLGLDKSFDVCIRNNLFYANGEKWTLLRRGLDSLLSNMSCEFDLHECLSGTNGDTNVQQLLSGLLDYVFMELLAVDRSAIKLLRSHIQKRTLVNKYKSYLKDIFPSLYVFFGLSSISSQTVKKVTDAVNKSNLLQITQRAGLMQEFGIKSKNKEVPDNELAFSTLSLFITEGYIPCLNIITALLLELSLNSEIQDKARNSVSKDNREDYMDFAIKETLRLHPPYSVITRECTKMFQYPDTNLIIDKKVTINIPVEAIHKDEEYYEKADVFNPDRFLDDESFGKHCYSYIPFGAGPRKCIGKGF